MLVRLCCSIVLAACVLIPHTARAQNCAEEISRLMSRDTEKLTTRYNKVTKQIQEKGANPKLVQEECRIARQLGPIQYGILTSAMATAALCGIISALGLDEIVQRDLIKAGRAVWNSALGTAFVLRLRSAYGHSTAYATVIVTSTPHPDTRTASLRPYLPFLLNHTPLFSLYYHTPVD